jgi:hypothetical protein
METAVDAIREAAMRLLREGEVHPQINVMAATRVAGGLGAAAALATGQDVEGCWATLPRPYGKPGGITTKRCGPSWKRCRWLGTPRSGLQKRIAQRPPPLPASPQWPSSAPRVALRCPWRRARQRSRAGRWHRPSGSRQWSAASRRARRAPRATCLLLGHSHVGTAQSENRPSASVPDTGAGQHRSRPTHEPPGLLLLTPPDNTVRSCHCRMLARCNLPSGHGLV